MPGQRKRRERERREADARREREASGRWERRFSTLDEAELRAYLKDLARSGVSPEDVRIDRACGRLVHPTGYTVSVLVPGP
ncbi:hypothetical protein GCM10010302_47590 [Streptomyces polychromogenes]|uniref:Integrase n=1 Tax=Streptomyces polychromogenes TaxID=67342 RepID=A0ABP3F9B6_9ACTN